MPLLAQIVAAILAVGYPGHRIPLPTAEAHAAIVARVSADTGIDPFEIVGIVHNESDWRPHLVSRDGKDCGIAQTRVTGSQYTCQQLTASAELSIRELARELTSTRESCIRDLTDASGDRLCTCGKCDPLFMKQDLDRCRLNRFNSGYAKANCAPGDESCRVRARTASRYWLRVLCFADAARHGEHGHGCRKATTLPARYQS